jgi:hypothetical protein
MTDECLRLHKTWLNIVVEWLTLLLHIQEVQGSNLILETRYDDWGFCGFLQSLQATAGMVP